MDKELAQMVINTAARARMELGNLMPILKAYGDAAKDEPVKMAIASAVYETGLIIDHVFKEFPDLKIAAEARLNAYGRSYF